MRPRCLNQVPYLNDDTEFKVWNQTHMHHPCREWGQAFVFTFVFAGRRERHEQPRIRSRGLCLSSEWGGDTGSAAGTSQHLESVSHRPHAWSSSLLVSWVLHAFAQEMSSLMLGKRKPRQDGLSLHLPIRARVHTHTHTHTFMIFTPHAGNKQRCS